jgi:hypothetical protein
MVFLLVREPGLSSPFYLERRIRRREIDMAVAAVGMV